MKEEAKELEMGLNATPPKEAMASARWIVVHHLPTSDCEFDPLVIHIAETIAAKDAELTKLKADVVKLRTALEPFAKTSKFLDGQPRSLIYVGDDDMVQKEFKYFRNAARALEETKP